MDLDLSRSDVADIYDNAHARWTNVIVGDSNVARDSSSLPTDQQGPAGCPSVLDDLYIYGLDECIDGPGRTLGFAGPRFIDTSTGRPWSGIMSFDKEDIPALIPEGRFEAVILHEMGHVLGIGTIWNNFNLNQNNNFVGVNAVDVWQNVYGCPGFPPIETDGGPGTAGSHWDKDTLNDELMTGFLGANNPLSALTIASLADLGYVVDLMAADEVNLFLDDCSDHNLCEILPTSFCAFFLFHCASYFAKSVLSTKCSCCLYMFSWHSQCG